VLYKCNPFTISTVYHRPRSIVLIAWQTGEKSHESKFNVSVHFAILSPVGKTDTETVLSGSLLPLLPCVSHQHLYIGLLYIGLIPIPVMWIAPMFPLKDGVLHDLIKNRALFHSMPVQTRADLGLASGNRMLLQHLAGRTFMQTASYLTSRTCLGFSAIHPPRVKSGETSLVVVRCIDISCCIYVPLHDCRAALQAGGAFAVMAEL